jgi:hypothetical protein
MSIGPPSRVTPQAITQEDVVITHEDVDRAHDRVRVSAARAQRGAFSKFRLLWLLVGPGILVMLGENDGPSMNWILHSLRRSYVLHGNRRTRDDHASGFRHAPRSCGIDL